MLDLARRRPLCRLRRGFTIVEIIVTLLIMAVLAAVMVPALKGRLNAAEASAIVDNLKQIRAAVVAYREDVGRYPRYLTQLQARPSAGLVGNVDLCGATLPQSAINSWKGPYLAQRSTVSGLTVGNSTILNEIKRNADPTATQPEGFAIIEIQNADLVIVQEVDRAFDPLVGQANDLIGGAVTLEVALLRFWIAVRGC